MAQRVFFSFHYHDVANFRANVVRNHWRSKPNREICGYYDASIWETAKTQGDIAIKRLINNGLGQTSNTCVLIGTETYSRKWVRYELLKSFKRGNNIFAVHINSIKGKDSLTKPLGLNPLLYVGVTFSSTGDSATLWEKENNQWIQYDKIDGRATYNTHVDSKYWGKGYNLSNFFKTYDWVSDDGFLNFKNWVG